MILNKGDWCNECIMLCTKFTEELCPDCGCDAEVHIPAAIVSDDGD